MRKIVFIFFMLFELNANAYIDPGTGSLVIQAVLAAFLTVGVTVKVFWHQIKEKYRKLFHKDEPEK